MLETLKQNEAFEYKKLSADEMKSRGILGRLIGPCADFINPTRNGRGYGENLWDRVFEDSIVNEKIENKCLFGELGHPADRDEVDPEKIAIALNEKPKKDKNGKLLACFDILDTPNGRILKALCDYGTKIGISSRGTGEVIGDEVDPDSYNFECFDAVITPAVKEARMNYVTEGLDSRELNLRKALRESLDSATEDERRVMEQTLNELDIKVEDETVVNPEEDEHKSAEKEDSNKTTDNLEEAKDNGSDELMVSLQEALTKNSELETQVKDLQEKLAVSNAKASKLEEENGSYKTTTVKMSKLVVENKDLISKVSTLEEELAAKNKANEGLQSRISKLVADKKAVSEAKDCNLTESLSQKDAEIKLLNENFEEIKSGYEKTISELNESIETMKAESTSKEDEFKTELAKETRLKEGYRKLAQNTVNRYIESKAVMLGVQVEEIKGKLPADYTVDDIDSICENLQSYQVNMNKLPFNVDKKVKVKVSKSTNESLNPDSDMDDVIDESLYRLAGLM